MKQKIFLVIIYGIVLGLPYLLFAKTPDGSAETAWAARQKVAQIKKAITEAGRDLSTKAKAVNTTKDIVTAATKAVEKTKAEETAAQKALKSAQGEEKKEAEKTLKGKTAAAQKASKALTSAKQAAEKAFTEKTAAGKLVENKKKDLIAPLEAAASAHAKALGGLKPITSEQWDYAKAKHLLFRAGFGGTPEEIEKLFKMGPHKAVDYLVDFHEQKRPAIEPDRDIYSRELPLAYEMQLPQEAQDRLAEIDEERNVYQHAAMVRWWINRLINTPRPLEEKLVLFWHDHFASSYRSLGTAYPMYRQNQLLRLYSDNYEALLHGIVQDPAMIKFLNNDENIKGSNNENLGRELLELFTLGEEHSSSHIPNGYTEKDVRDGNTRSLTGASYDEYASQYRFYHSKHDATPKTLLGKKGNWGTHEAVDIMLEHPGTSRYLTKKLWQFFVYWDAEPEILDQMALVLKENGYRIRPLLKNIFLSEQFYGKKAMGTHIKSPVELLIGTVKVVGLPKASHQNIRFRLASMGQSLFDPPSVAGWAEGETWINTTLLLARYTATANLVKEGKGDYVALLKTNKLTKTEDAVDHLTRRFLVTELSPEKRKQLIDFLGPLPPQSEWESKKKELNAKLQALVVLLVSSPEYQVS